MEIPDVKPDLYPIDQIFLQWKIDLESVSAEKTYIGWRRENTIGFRRRWFLSWINHVTTISLRVFFQIEMLNINKLISYFPRTYALMSTVIFPIWTNLYHLLQVGGGAGLAFMTFCEVFLAMPAGPLWSALFFIMLILLGIDSEFGTLEGLVAPFYDMKWVKLRKEIFTGTCAIAYVYTYLNQKKV